MTKFSEGDHVFLRNGAKAIYEQKVDGGGHIVIVIDPDGEETTIFVDEVFETFPPSHQKEVLKELEERRRELSNKVLDLHKEIALLEEERDNLVREAEKWTALKAVLPLLKGEIEWFVVWKRNNELPVILPFDEVMVKGRSLASPWTSCDFGKLRMISLFGKSRNRLEWRVNEFSDGSGAWKTVVPCKTREEAEEEVFRLCERFIRDLMEPEHEVDFSEKRTVCAILDKFREKGRKLPSDVDAWARKVAREYHDTLLRQARNTVEQKMSELDEARMRVKELEKESGKF